MSERAWCVKMHPTCRLAQWALVAGAVVLMVAPAARGQDARAVDQALVFLARQQREDGSFAQGAARNVLTAQVALAFLAAGQPPGAGRFGLVMTKAHDFLLTSEDDPRVDGDVILALSQLLGVPGDEAHLARTRAALMRKIPLLTAAQLPSGAFPSAAGEEAISATCRAVLALHAAEKAGMAIPSNAMSDAIRFLSGSIPSDVDQVSRVALALTLGGVPVTEQFALLGQVSRAEKLSPVSAAMVAVLSQLVPAEIPVRAPALPAQNGDGSFPATPKDQADVSGVRSTAMAILVMTAPSRLLPGFRR